jgi:hypothetical protein
MSTLKSNKKLQTRVLFVFKSKGRSKAEVDKSVTTATATSTIHCLGRPA